MKVLLLHFDKEAKVLHYRFQLYNYFSRKFLKEGCFLSVMSESFQEVEDAEFEKILSNYSLFRIIKHVIANKVEKVVLFINLGRLNIFFLIPILRMLGVEVVYWGHGTDLQDPSNKIKPFLYRLLFLLVNKIIMYSLEMKLNYVPKFFHHKTFHANNSISMENSGCKNNPINVLKSFGIHTKFNVIVVGRIQARKRVSLICDAIRKINDDNVGLIIVGQVDDDSLDMYKDDRNIFFTGALYGPEKNDLVNSCDLYCLPGTVGLSIIEALYYGKPFITVDDGVSKHSPEICYLHNGSNGFALKDGSPESIAKIILNYKNDVNLLRMHQQAAFEIYMNEANVEIMANSFIQAVRC